MLKIDLLTELSWTVPIYIDCELGGDIVQAIDEYFLKVGKEAFPVTVFTLRELEGRDPNEFHPINGGQYFILGIASVEEMNYDSLAQEIFETIDRRRLDAVALQNIQAVCDEILSNEREDNTVITLARDIVPKLLESVGSADKQNKELEDRLKKADAILEEYDLLGSIALIKDLHTMYNTLDEQIRIHSFILTRMKGAYEIPMVHAAILSTLQTIKAAMFMDKKEKGTEDGK